MNAPRSVAEIEFPVDVQLHPSPRDWRDHFIYFLLVDRFDNNDGNVHPYNPGAPPHGREFGQRNRFRGGNLNGIRRRLDYIRQLCCIAGVDFFFPGTELHDMLSPDLRTTVTDVGGRSALPVEMEPHGLAFYRRQ